jgi:hypothetical protein
VPGAFGFRALTFGRAVTFFRPTLAAGLAFFARFATLFATDFFLPAFFLAIFPARFFADFLAAFRFAMSNFSGKWNWHPAQFESRKLPSQHSARFSTPTTADQLSMRRTRKRLARCRQPQRAQAGLRPAQCTHSRANLRPRSGGISGFFSNSLVWRGWITPGG